MVAVCEGIEKRHIMKCSIYQINELKQYGCYFYKRATIDDLEVLVSSRIQVLKAANQLADDVDMSEVERESRDYYIESFKENSHIAYLVYDADKIIGAGGISFYRVMPTYHNPSGRKAYVMNMYTHPQYRRKGIALKTLQLLVEEARSRGIKQISLEATQAGKPLYQKYGFVEMKDEMELEYKDGTAKNSAFADCKHRNNR